MCLLSKWWVEGWGWMGVRHAISMLMLKDLRWNTVGLPYLLISPASTDSTNHRPERVRKFQKNKI
jgi:hypothetical protein